METRAEVERRFVVRAVWILVPLAVIIVGTAALLAMNQNALAVVAFPLLIVLAVAWNGYVFLVWRPRLDRRFPPDGLGRPIDGRSAG